MLLVLTSDGALRVYGFGHLDLAAPLRPGADAVVPLPSEPPSWTLQARGGGRIVQSVPGRVEEEDDSEAERRHAAAAAVTASDSESGEEVTSPGRLTWCTTTVRHDERCLGFRERNEIHMFGPESERRDLRRNMHTARYIHAE